MTAVVASKHFDVVFLQERAISEIIYLTDIKLALQRSRISSKPHLITAPPLPEVLSLPDDVQSRGDGAALVTGAVLLTTAKAPSKLPARPWSSKRCLIEKLHSSLTKPDGPRAPPPVPY